VNSPPPPLLQHAPLPLGVKSLNNTGAFVGYASTYAVDHHKDQVVPGAFAHTLKQWRQKQKLPLLLWNHRLEEPLGFWTHVQEDPQGLYVEGQLLMDLQRAKEAYLLMKRNILSGLSIGFRILMARRLAATQVRKIYQLDLVEISVVTSPANTHARVLDLKAQPTFPV